MGKGRRNRDLRQELKPFEVLYAKAEKQQRLAGGFAAAALVVTVLGLFLPVWSVAILDRNLAAAQYMEEELRVLTPLLPVGRLSLGMIGVGAAACAILLWCRRPVLSSVAFGLCAVGDGLLVYFAVLLGQVFAYDPLEQRGLAFSDLLVRYYVLLLPLIFLAVALVCALSARKKKTVAAVMETAADTTPTVLLGAEEA